MQITFDPDNPIERERVRRWTDDLDGNGAVVADTGTSDAPRDAMTIVQGFVGLKSATTLKAMGELGEYTAASVGQKLGVDAESVPGMFGAMGNISTVSVHEEGTAVLHDWHMEDGEWHYTMHEDIREAVKALL